MTMQSMGHLRGTLDSESFLCPSGMRGGHQTAGKTTELRSQIIVAPSSANHIKAY
jgi:hypothetical protein